MGKLVSIVLFALMSVSVIGCGKGYSAKSAGTASFESTPPAPASTPAPAPAPSPSPAPAGSVPMPGASNRPTFDSTSQVLSWSGPVGGGVSTGTYTVQTRVLKASGAITTTADGQIIEGLRITSSGALDHGIITVKNNNVIIRQNSIGETTVGQPDKYTIFIAAGVTGT
ncbi:MAG: hypothetical protein ACXWQE_13110, partial [Bdellovibrionales bacterium]